jgi:hypothetical protein
MGFVYPRVKARHYAEVEPETYRRHDFIRRPDAGMTEEDPAAAMHGLTRLPEGIGAAPDRWFTGTGIPGFNGMAHTFHLEYDSREIVGGHGCRLPRPDDPPPHRHGRSGGAVQSGADAGLPSGTPFCTGADAR